MKTPPASSRHLSAFAIDIHYELEQTGLFSKIKIKKTGTPKCALVVTCTLADISTTPEEVSRVLEGVWKESLAYSHGANTHQIAARPGSIEMEFSTSSLDSTITGCIEVVGFAEPGSETSATPSGYPAKSIPTR